MKSRVISREALVTGSLVSAEKGGRDHGPSAWSPGLTNSRTQFSSVDVVQGSGSVSWPASLVLHRSRAV